MRVPWRVRMLLRRFGLDVVRIGAPGPALLRKLRLRAGCALLDVGANAGLFGGKMREAGFTGRIISFEPLDSAFAALQAKAASAPPWETVNVALGERDGEVAINIAANSYSSSLLDMLPRHVRSAPESAYVGTQRATMRRLDCILNDYCRPEEQCFLKVDVQGYEKMVLEGARGSLGRIYGMLLEMSLAPLYAGAPSFSELLEYVTKLGYVLVSLDPGLTDEKTGELLQADGLFFRRG